MAAAKAVPSNLSLPRNSLIGRQHELAAVQQLLLQEEMALLTLTGPGGIGKTRLAMQVAANLSDHFVDVFYIVSLAPITDATLVLPAIAQTLGVHEASGRSIQQSLQEYLQHKQTLLVLDNFEQIVTAAPLVGELLTSCRRLKILVTSRVTLHLYGEQEFPVPPLALPPRRRLRATEAILLGTLANVAAIQLFTQRALAAKPDFVLNTTNAAAVAEICHALDGLPLALELAAAKIKLFAPAALLERLQQRLTLLTGGPLDLPPRQRTLRDEISWSYDLLPAGQQVLFRNLAVFARGFTLAAAQAVSQLQESSVLEGVTTLVDHNLLRQEQGEDGEPRLWMLETIREYALEELTASGETETVCRRHALFFLELAEATEPQLLSAQRPRVLAQLQAELDNLRAAVHWSLEFSPSGDESHTGSHTEIGLRLAGALVWFAHFGNHFNEVYSWLVRALDASARATAYRAKALWAAGLAALSQGDSQAAIIHLEESVALWRKLDDPGGLSLALRELSYVMISQEPAAALPTSVESVALARSVGRNWQLAMCVFILGTTLTAVGDQEAAREVLAEANLLFREIGDAWGISITLFTLGLTSGQQGDYESARSQLTEAVTGWPAKEDDWSRSQVLTLLGEVTQLQNDPKAAIPLYIEGLQLSLSVNDKTQVALILRHLGSVARSFGEYERSIQLFAAATLWEVSGANAFMPLIDPALCQAEIAELRADLGEEPFAAQWEKGRLLTLEQVIDWASALPRVAEGESEQGALAMPSAATPFDELTSREVEVLRFLVQGLTYAQIADQLIISHRTVNTHATSIYSKLGVSSRAAATRFALDHHLR